ncbi:MAG: hypothetical protein KAY13_00150 [Zoogloea sp.]|nr:hypothetical protein [Zoogloea sp.]
MNNTRIYGLAVGLLALVCLVPMPLLVAAEMPTAMPEVSAPAPECPVLQQEAEATFARGLQAAAVKGSKEAIPLLREAGSTFLKVAAGCPSVAIQANRQGDQVTAALKMAEVAASHQSDCLPRFDKALDLDIRAAAVRVEKGDPAEVERLLAEAEGIWREALTLCQPPHREKAEKSLAATVRTRTTNAELLSAGPACDAAWKNAGALIDYAKVAWKDKHWDDAAMLYSKAVMAWEGAVDKCVGTRQQQAQRKVEQTQIDAHNAEFCGPLWDSATEQSQRLKGGGASVSATERDVLSVKAEVIWRDAVAQCRGNPQTLARTNADALARERGTPLPAQAMAMYGSKRPALPAAVVPSVPGPTSVAITPSAPPSREAPVVTSAALPVSAPAVVADAVLVAGDTTYRGAFAVDPKSGVVSGSGTIAWRNGESFSGTLVNGRRQGKGRFNWVSGQWYEGDWVDDRSTGHGVIQFPGGNRYEGAVSDGEPQGRGSLIFATGDRYTGDFVRGVFHGQGTYAWKSGNRYEGAWSLGKKHGQGRLTWVAGDAWEGEFRDDQKTESGKDVTAAALAR